MSEPHDDRAPELPVSHGGVWSNKGGLMFMPRRVLAATIGVAVVAGFAAALIYLLT
ncbi:MAG TPA: hypothetical protein VM204_02625 [Gaiellaceae bacterium]|nr:hypothetical protein [Gaiellaceae bacterium]